MSLPSERTCVTIYTGVMFKMKFIYQSYKELKQEKMSFPDEERLFGLILNEMTIKSGIVLDKSDGKMIGFADLGSVNCEMDSLAESLTGGLCKRSITKIVDHMLSFMVRPVYKPSRPYTVHV